MHGRLLEGSNNFEMLGADCTAKIVVVIIMLNVGFIALSVGIASLSFVWLIVVVPTSDQSPKGRNPLLGGSVHASTSAR